MGTSDSGRPRQNGVPHAAADGAVEFADGVAEGGEAQRQDGHAEILVVVGGVPAAESEELALADAETRIEGGEIAIHQGRGEIVVAGGHGRVRGEDLRLEEGEERRPRRSSDAAIPISKAVRSSARKAEWPSFM